MSARPLTFLSKGYWAETRRPVYSAALVLPFLLVYEVGMVVLRPRVINGGDAIIRRILNFFSVHVAFASVLVLLGCFAYWQTRTGASWRIERRKLILLYLESLGFAILLFFFLGWLSTRVCLEWPGMPVTVAVSGPGAGHPLLLELVLYCGAGIYEELVFRVLLLALLMQVFSRLLHWDSEPAAAASVLLGAVIFSLFHYVGEGGDRFQVESFLQRTFAGVYFAALYVTRGFGVAAASHALYDILVGLRYFLVPG